MKNNEEIIEIFKGYRRKEELDRRARVGSSHLILEKQRSVRVNKRNTEMGFETLNRQIDLDGSKSCIRLFYLF